MGNNIERTLRRMGIEEYTRKSKDTESDPFFAKIF